MKIVGSPFVTFALRVLALATVVLLALVIRVLPISAQSAANDIGSAYLNVSKPTNLLDLFRNIKLATDRGLLIRRDFYSDGNLRKLFGGEKVEWDADKADPLRIRGYVYDFGAIGAQVPASSGRLADTLTLRFRFEANRDGMVEANLWLYLPGDYSNRPSFADIEGLFGSNWTLVNQDMWPAHKPYKAPTAPHGNDLIHYRSVLLDLKVNVDFEFEFSFDGRVGIADLSMKGPKR